jgi:UDP:flavonoid glycosyltransferase YjiC (YdhE family)
MGKPVEIFMTGSTMARTSSGRDKDVVAVFCMPEDGHFKQLYALICDLVNSGSSVHVFTHRRYMSEIKHAGAIAVDLFSRYSLEEADGESSPFPCRYVSFAAAFATNIARELQEIHAGLVIYETFAVIGRVAAQVLGLPYVNVSPGHNLDPAHYLPALATEPRVRISSKCFNAVEVLRKRFAMSDASPFSYISGLSPHLNLHCQPPDFLTAEERRSFEPIAFYGCIPSAADRMPSSDKRDYFSDPSSALKVYACFGTVVFKYFAEAARDALLALSECMSNMPEACAVISLGGATAETVLLRRLERTNVRVFDFVDQWRALGEADIFLTHHGMNSTHEAVIRGVPMLGYPFFTDQPALAERCYQFDISRPLVDFLRAPVRPEDISKALKELRVDQKSMRASIECARSLEFEVMANRPLVIQQIKSLAGQEG